MKKNILLSIATSVLVMAGGDMTPALPVAESQGTELGIFSNMTYNGEIRSRYEFADDSINNNGKAFTTRLALSMGADISAVNGLSIFTQMMAVENFGFDKYAPETTGYATIDDAVNSRITQAYLTYKMGDTLLRAGRQMVNLDDQRFIGAVDWRQMPQTFAGYTIANSSIENLDLMASYVTQRYGIKDALSGSTETVLLHADYKVAPALKLSAYGYLIGSSSNTYGLMASGKVGRFNYIAEVATQKDSTLGDVDTTVDALYYRLDVSTNYNGFILGAAYESMDEAGAGDSHGFTTPLATLHKWQGFADAFLGYTAGSNTYGLEDLYAKVGYADAKLGKLLVFYHDFSAKVTTPGLTDDAGSEVDVVYSYTISKNLDFLAKAAFFDGENNSVITAAQNDITKYWVQLDYKF